MLAIELSSIRLVISVLVSETSDPPLQTVACSPETARPANAAVVEIGVVCGLDIGVFAIIAGNGGGIACVEEALAFLLLVVFLEGGGVLHFDCSVVVDLVCAKGAVEGKCVALTFEVFRVVVLGCNVSRQSQIMSQEKGLPCHPSACSLARR